MSLKKKKRKRNVNDVPNGKNALPPAYLHSPSQNPGPGSVPKEKKEKGTLMTFPMAKTPFPQLTFIAQAEIQAQEASPKEKKVKGTLMTFPMAKRKTNLNLLSKPKPKSKVQEGVL